MIYYDDLKWYKQISQSSFWSKIKEKNLICNRLYGGMDVFEDCFKMTYNGKAQELYYIQEDLYHQMKHNDFG